ncbi:MAG TPA: hypothetical protein VLC09_13140, partial [Polyangiaceae bacterium]|nr:hypothetical protein [Polyangiaceae bacterium]
SRLELSLRTSHSPIHGVRIPASALLESVTLDGQEQSAKNEAGLVRVALRPGSHRLVVEWQENTGLTTSFRSSSVDLGAEATNFRTSIQIPADRWLLAAGGPGYGPAILFWGYLVLIVVAAFLLPLVPGSRLRHYQWLLLGLGLTQVPALVAVSIVGWFFFVEGRARYWAKTQRFKNFLQLVLIGGTVLFLVALTGAVYQGLVFSPDMEIAGSDSYAGQLSWYVDRSPSSTQPVWFVSTSLWAWRAVMLVWALWLARSLLDWLRWAWTVAHQDGFWAEPSATGKRGGLWRFVPGRADATADATPGTTAEPTAGAGEAAGASDAAPAGTPVPEAGEDPEATAPPDGPS